MSEENQVPTSPACTFGIDQSFAAFDSGWRTFPGHYLLYASSGVFHLEVDNARWLLPPQRAAWIAAHVPIRVTVDGAVTCSSVLFTESSIAPPEFACRIFAVSVLAREMLLYAMQWGPQRNCEDEQANNFFLSLANVCKELATHADEFWLPSAQSAELASAMEYTLANLHAAPTFEQVAKAVHLSARTLARRFAEETTMTWSQFTRRARMIQAMELLAEPTTKVIEIVYAIGFSSVSSFNHAFREFTGESPSSYRKRVQPNR